MFMFLHVFTCCFYLLCASACFTRVWVFVCYPAYVHSCLSTVWPSRTLPAVLTLVCVDSKHSCRSQRPRSGWTRGSEGRWWRGEREGAGRQGMEGEIRGKGSSLVRYRARKRKEKWLARGGHSSCRGQLKKVAEVVRSSCGQICHSKGQERDDEREEIPISDSKREVKMKERGKTLKCCLHPGGQTQKAANNSSDTK